MNRASRSDSDKEVVRGPIYPSPSIPENEINHTAKTVDSRNLRSSVRNSFASSFSGSSLPYDYTSPDRFSPRAVSSIGREDERNETTSVVSWTVDSRSEVNSIHTSPRSLVSLPMTHTADTIDPLLGMLRRELGSPQPGSDSFLLRVARDTLGIHHVETRTSDRLLQFAILLSKGGLTSFGASLYHYLILRECQQLHGIEFIVKLILRYLGSGQTDVRWSKLGRIAWKLINHLMQDQNNPRSLQLAQILAAFLLCTPIRIEEKHRLEYLLSLATQAVGVANWKSLMETDIVDLKDFLDLETRVIGLRTGQISMADTSSTSQSEIWQKGSFRVYMTRSGTLHLREIVEWALQPVEDVYYYRRIGEYSKRLKSKQMFQATYLSLINRLISDTGRIRQSFEPHLTVNTRDTTFRLNEYESIAIISYLLVNIKSTMSLMFRNDSDEYLSVGCVNTFFNNIQLLEDTMHSTLKNYFSNRDTSGTTRDGADDFILGLVRRVANHNKEWQGIIYPTHNHNNNNNNTSYPYRHGHGHGHGRQGSVSSISSANPQPSIELAREPDMMVVPVAPLERQPSKVELPVRSTSRAQPMPTPMPMSIPTPTPMSAYVQGR